jgi:hypothetical protein
MIRRPESAQDFTRDRGQDAQPPHPHALVKVLVTSLIVGTIMGHFSISIDTLIKAVGPSRERIEDMARNGIA